MIPYPSLVWGSPSWVGGALAILAVAAVAVLVSYTRARSRPSVRIACATLKAFGFAALALALLEPLLAGTRPRRGANAFAILADNSQSLQVRDADTAATRGEWLRERLGKDLPWKARLGQDYDVRNYVFDTHLRASEGFESLAFDGDGSALSTSLDALARRFRGLPLAGVLLFTDGNRTDLANLDTANLPPVYPVLPPSRGVARDIGVGNIAVSQTNFESAPVVLRADVSAVGYAGQPVVAVVTDSEGKEVERQSAKPDAAGKPLSFRFQFRPIKRGVNFYKVHAFAADDEVKGTPAKDAPPVTPSAEQTLANNSRLVLVDQGGGPYRVLYVGGRPNWEFKYLRRALDDDEQVQLVGLVRIAKRQPKFDFQASGSRTTSPFFTGFDNVDAETAERADQPVLVRLGTADDVELRDGFPKTADELYAYHAVVIDDLESSFFTPDQLALLRNFVSVRGGGLLMLGGPDSFTEGKYDRTPVGELLPVYLNGRAAAPVPADDRQYRLSLTQEGWLQPWVRTRKTEDEERLRLGAMSTFQTLTRVGEPKPGAYVLARVTSPEGDDAPALVAQQFGKGHVAALLLGDLWRWGLAREKPEESDLERSWRQTVRWLVGDVPGRVDVSVRPREGSASPAVDIRARARDPEYRPLDNAKVALKLTLPDGSTLALDAEPDNREAGAYTATYVARQPGPYRVLATATAPDGSPVAEREAGWAAQPAADEFARLEPDLDYLKSLAAKTGGEVVDGDRLDAFVKSLANRDAPVNEPWTSPLWHNPWYFFLAIASLVAEWGLRRANGLP